MPVQQLGAINVAALQVADVYIQLVQPQFLLNGVPSNIFGVVGTAQWGPVNQATICGGYAQYVQAFGNMQPRSYDMGTAAWIAFMQRATIGKFVRVTDGSDVAATIVIQTNCLTLTAKYTGSLGNVIQAFIGVGSAASSYRARIVMPGQAPEIFDNIFKGVSSVGSITAGTGYTSAPTVTFSPPQVAGGRTATGHAVLSTTTVGSVVIDDPGTGYTSAPTVTFSGGGGSGAAGTAVISAWPAITDAINNGQSGQRGPSNYVIATAGAGTTTPSETGYTLAAGTDGAAGITGSIMLGSDSLPRTGMYALREGECLAGFMLADMTDTSTWASQVAFGIAEASPPVLCGPSGQSISSGATAKTSAAIDTFCAKILLGDWVYINDSVNGLPNRLVSPQAFYLGRRANLSPEQSSLNKEVLGVVATQKSSTGVRYTGADLQTLATSGIDVLCTPAPGGGYFAFRNGRNASSNASIHGENYTHMTFFIATTLDKGMGIYIGALQSRRRDDPTRFRAKATLDAFLSNMANTQPYPMIDDFQVVLDKTNNADNTIGLGYMFAYAKVVYMSVVEFFVINLEGGQTVQITRQSNAPF